MSDETRTPEMHMQRLRAIADGDMADLYSYDSGSVTWALDALAAAEARAERAEAERDALIAAWPGVYPIGSAKSVNIGFYRQGFSDIYPTREAAVRAAAGLTEGGGA